MADPITLRPIDIPVALRLAQQPAATYAAIGGDLGISTSTAHAAVDRLTLAGLLYPHVRRVNRHHLIEFLEHGIRYAFPASLHGKAVGVATAYAGPPLAGEIASEPMVWPAPGGTSYGDAVDPLYPGAVDLPTRCPPVYEMLTLVDAMRVGRARERRLAADEIRSRLRAEPDSRND